METPLFKLLAFLQAVPLVATGMLRTWPCDIKHAQYHEGWDMWASLWKNSPAFPSSCRLPEKESSSWGLEQQHTAYPISASGASLDVAAMTLVWRRWHLHLVLGAYHGIFWEMPETKIKCDGLPCNGNLWLHCWPIFKYSGSNSLL